MVFVEDPVVGCLDGGDLSPWLFWSWFSGRHFLGMSSGFALLK